MDFPIHSGRSLKPVDLPARYARSAQRIQGGQSLKIGFNASRGPRSTAPQRSQGTPNYSHPTKMPVRHSIIDFDIQSPLSSPPAAEVHCNDDLLQLKIKDGNSKVFSVNETEPIPEIQVVDCLSDATFISLEGPRPLSTSMFPKPPRSSNDNGRPILRTLEAEHTSLVPKTLRQSPLRDDLKPTEQPAKENRPKDTRRRLPSAWIEASLSQPSLHPLPPLPIALSPESPSPLPFSIRPIKQAPFSPVHDHEFGIPRKPPPIPKVSTAPKLVGLKYGLFPSSPTETSPLGSLRSGSTLVGTSWEGDLPEPPNTPTAVTPLAKKFATGDDFSNRASCSPGQTSGWYDDEEEGIERIGLLARWKRRRSGGGGWRRLLCGCSGS